MELWDVFFLGLPIAGIGIRIQMPVAALCCMVYVFFSKKLSLRFYVLLSKKGIEAFLPKFLPGNFAKINCKWPGINSIHSSPFDVELCLKDGSEKKIEIDSLVYEQNTAFRTKLNEYINLHCAKESDSK